MFFLVALSIICQTVVSPVDLLLARPSRAVYRDLIFSFSNVIYNQVISFEVCFLPTLNTFGFLLPNFGNCASAFHSFKTTFLCSAVNGSVFPFSSQNHISVPAVLILVSYLHLYSKVAIFWKSGNM
jgi:hypothetical protein